MKRRNRSRQHALIAATSLFAAAAIPLSALAQNYDAMIQRSWNRMNQIIANGEQQVTNIVQQRMQDPQVQASYQRYVAQRRNQGQPAMDYRIYTYNYVYTRGFSREGIAHAQSVEANNRAAEMAAAQRLRAAQAQTSAAMQQQRDSFFNNRQEAGRALMGQSTYQAPNGAPVVLPHTWQANTRHEHQGNTYHVDQSGQYFVRGNDGWWYPVSR